MSTRLRVPIVLLLLCLAVLVAACRSEPVSTATAGAPSTPPSTAASDPPAYPLTLTDDAGREVTIAAEPSRIVSLAPSNTEIVCALGACDALVGVPEFRDGYPADVLAAIEEVPNVVGFAEVDREAVVAAEADLVLAAGNELTRSADIEALADLGFPVLVLYPESLDELYADIELVGTAIGAGDEATTLLADMRERVAAVEEAVANEEAPRTFYEVSIFEGTIYTAGERSFLASLIEIAGGEPITGDPLSTSIQLEDLVAADPQVILLGDAAYDPTITPEAVAARPGWDGMAAVADGRILPMPEDLVITRPGPRIVDGLEALARAVHPGAFD